MGCHPSAGGDSSRYNRTFGLGDQAAATEQIIHVIPVVQDRQARLSISQKYTACRQPFNHSPNVFNSMSFGSWNVPKNRQKAPLQWFSWSYKLTEAPCGSITCDQLRVSHSHRSLIRDL